MEKQKQEIPKRAITEPPTNNVVKGPREGFIEDLDTNLQLIEKRFDKKVLTQKEFKTGSLTQTRILLLYVTEVADDAVVQKICKKIENIKIDGIIDASYVQSFLEDRPGSIFKQIGLCEKPDIAAAKMLEGRVAILVDGSPIVLTLPFILLEDLQNSEDYYEEPKKVTFVRVLRLLGVAMAVLMPAAYLSFQLFHYKALPLKFLQTILSTSLALPLTPTLELLFTFIMFEILYEASIRVPKGLGSSFNIVGALILGSTAVESNLASAPTVMIVALSSIALYLVPDQTNILRILRLGFIIAACMSGVIGVVCGIVFLTAYLSDFDSYHAAYLGPYAPYIADDTQDGIIKSSLPQMKTMPKSIPNKKKVR